MIATLAASIAHKLPEVLEIHKARGIQAFKAAEDWKTHAKIYDCNPAWLGKSYEGRTRRLTVMGLLLGRYKNCILLHDQNGKVFVASPEVVRMQLTRSNKALSLPLR